MFCNFPNNLLFPHWMFKFCFCWQQIRCQCIFRGDFLQNFNLSELVESVSEPPPQSLHNSPSKLILDEKGRGQGSKIEFGKNHPTWSFPQYQVVDSTGGSTIEFVYTFHKNTFQLGSATSGNISTLFLNQIKNKYQKYQTAMWRWLERGPCIFIIGEENHQMAFVRSNFDNAHSNTVFLCWSSL